MSTHPFPPPNLASPPTDTIPRFLRPIRQFYRDLVAAFPSRLYLLIALCTGPSLTIILWACYTLNTSTPSSHPHSDDEHDHDSHHSDNDRSLSDRHQFKPDYHDHGNESYRADGRHGHKHVMEIPLIFVVFLFCVIWAFLQWKVVLYVRREWRRGRREEARLRVHQRLREERVEELLRDMRSAGMV